MTGAVPLMSGPEGWTRLALGNQIGAVTWCRHSKANTDHNTAWHAKHLKAS
jgi:hypothetical protein